MYYDNATSLLPYSELCWQQDHIYRERKKKKEREKNKLDARPGRKMQATTHNGKKNSFTTNENVKILEKGKTC